MTVTIRTDASDTTVGELAAHGWPWLFTRSQDVIAADTIGDICGALMDGYAQIPAGDDGDREALLARWAYAAGLAQQLQETLAGLAHNRGRWQLGDPASDTATLLEDTSDTAVEEFLIGDRHQPVDNVAAWQHPVPLVLITTDYAPHTRRTRPDGNIIWLDPYTETSLLHSLTTAGLGRLYGHPASDLDPARN